VSLLVAIPLAVGSALVYAGATVVQHRVAGRSVTDRRASAAGLGRMLRDPAFVFSIVGDGIGFVLQVGALATGSVVVVQPLVVLMLPFALVVGAATGSRRPGRRDALGCAGVVGGLAAFLALIGQPGAAHRASTVEVAGATAAALAVTVLLGVGVRRRGAALRSATYGAVAGLCFGLLAVLVDAASTQARDDGASSVFRTAAGLAGVFGIIALAVAGVVLTQLSYQVGELGAAMPASLLVDPVAGVVLGAVLLHEAVPASAPRLFGYALCLVAALFGAVLLARPPTAPAQPSD
jgi:drug/metabolite transporter (DMT)-like permease